MGRRVDASYELKYSRPKLLEIWNPKIPGGVGSILSSARATRGCKANGFGTQHVLKLTDPKNTHGLSYGSTAPHDFASLSASGLTINTPTIPYHFVTPILTALAFSITTNQRQSLSFLSQSLLLLFKKWLNCLKQQFSNRSSRGAQA